MSIKPLSLKSKLKDAPRNKPLFAINIPVKGKDVTLADPRATRCMLALMDLGAVNGGAACHWGGPSAMMEMWTALHAIMFEKTDWHEHFNFVNDIGHAENGIYALRTNLGYDDLTVESLKGFRSIKSKLTGHGESHLYPEGVLLSNGPLASALPQAQGLAMADGITGKKRVTVVSVSDGAAMEGEAKEAFAAIPGLALKKKLSPFVMIVSDNNTKLGGRIDQDAFSMNPSFTALEVMGWNVIKVANGHDLAACYEALEVAIKEATIDPTRPVAIWAKTTKGFGVKSTASSSSGGHGFPLKAHDEGITAFLEEIWGGKDLPPVFTDWASSLMVKPEKKASSGPVKDKIQIGVSEALIKAAEEGLPVFSLSSDLAGSTGVKGFQSKFPTHFQDMGVAESNMVSAAAGMSKLGFIPVVDTFAAFGVTKGNLPLVMSSLSESPVIAVFSHTGFQDAADGASHQSLTYMSALASIPHVKLVNLGSAREAREYVYAAVKEIATKREKGEVASSYVFFLGRENFALEAKEGLNYQLGKPQWIQKGKKALVVTTGSLLPDAQKAVEGLDVGLIQHSFVNDVDAEFFANAVKECGGKLVTVEDHQLIAGMGAMLTHSLKLAGAEFKLKSLGVKGEFGQSSYTAKELYQKHGLDSEAIRKAVDSL